MIENGPPHAWLKIGFFTYKFVLGWTFFGSLIIFENLKVRNAYFYGFGLPKGYFKLAGAQGVHFTSFALAGVHRAYF